MRIDDLDQLNVLANAPEMDIGKLKLGQEAVIKASSNLGRVYHGVIESISLASKEEKDWERSRVEFPVTVRVTDQDANLEPGMSVILDVVARKVASVLVLGHEYVQKDGEKYFVVMAERPAAAPSRSACRTRTRLRSEAGFPKARASS